MILRHGIDIVHIERITQMLEKHGDRFRDRVFTATEQAYAEAGGNNRDERYAARFAAKEAALKAIGTGWSGGLAWTDVEIVNQVTGAPTLLMHGEAAAMAEQIGVQQWAVSLSHTDTVAMASVVGLGGGS